MLFKNNLTFAGFQISRRSQLPSSGMGTHVAGEICLNGYTTLFLCLILHNYAVLRLFLAICSCCICIIPDPGEHSACKTFDDNNQLIYILQFIDILCQPEEARFLKTIIYTILYPPKRAFHSTK